MEELPLRGSSILHLLQVSELLRANAEENPSHLPVLMLVGHLRQNTLDAPLELKLPLRLEQVLPISLFDVLEVFLSALAVGLDYISALVLEEESLRLVV